ncbi:NUDIX domain-containing protein [Pseudooceanicola onchidii]|uniref:NUDIX domain-containing protein n=1 Tax=Pseudooceanicola onchidii TaxID=2562279 RepID=UPI0010AAEA7A|nr:NUDIX hydrolase [Pseudooceanicola onchidii]
MEADHTSFGAAKLILLIGGKLLVIRRDDRPDIPWPDHLDFPGGGREGSETAEVCVLRETEEELGLSLSAADLIWRVQAPGPSGPSIFFAAEFGPDIAHDVVLGDEGQSWELMPPRSYFTHPQAIPHFADRLADYLAIRMDQR